MREAIAPTTFVSIDQKTGIPFDQGSNPQPISGSVLYMMDKGGKIEPVSGEENDTTVAAAEKYSKKMFPENKFDNPQNIAWEPHLRMDKQFMKDNQISSDEEIHYHEIAHGVWAALNKIALGYISSHLDPDATTPGHEF